jgi:osmotically-inducible protein OsmY
MTRSAALLMLPSHPQSNADEAAVQTTARLLAQSLEGLQLAERVEHSLRATGYGSLCDLSVTVHDRFVILGGKVPSYHLKQIAQATALSVPGVDQLRNDLEVVRPS